MLLVCAIPAGLGVDNGDIRTAIFMWFIPAIAMYISSYFSKHIGKRISCARRDYAFLLIGIAIIEIITALLVFASSDSTHTLILSCIFVFFYAFAKEGIPKIFYDVQIYRFFVTDENYARLAGWNNALEILARASGGFLAAYFLFSGTWKSAFIVDAITFIVFGATIWAVGRDKIKKTEDKNLVVESQTTSEDSSEKKYLPLFSMINVVIPLFFAFNALSWNYIALILKELSIAEVSEGIFFLTLLQIPGLILGANFDRLKKVVAAKHFILTVPMLFFASVMLFFIFPSAKIYYLCVFIFGLTLGLIWPAEKYVKSRMEDQKMIRFNNLVLKRLSIFQFISCVLAFAIYSFDNFRIPIIIASIAMGLIIFLSRGFNFNAIKATPVGMLLTIVALFSSCSPNTYTTTNVYLPSVSRDMRMRSELTYAAMAIVNDTSAHLTRVSRKLVMEGQVLEHYKSFDNDKRYILTLKNDYKSIKGESLNAQDLLFTIKWYLTENRGIAAHLEYIVGAKDCHSIDCNLQGAKILGNNVLELTLDRTDRFFMDKFSSPWIVLLKKGKPTIETIGQCQLPYQTGIAQITECNKYVIELSYGKKKVNLYNSKYLPVGRARHRATTAQLLTDPPGNKKYTSLTVMSAFANPNSKTLNREQRIAIMSNIRNLARSMSEDLRLSYSPTITPKWLSVSVSDEILNVKRIKFQCPKRPIKILLDTSLPGHEILKRYLTQISNCQIEFNITEASRYFKDFAKNDIGIAWFTPDFLTVYNIFSIFDCDTNACYFNWKDSKMQGLIREVKRSVELGNDNIELATKIENHLFKNGYASPIADMNWWIKKGDKIEVIHQAGLFQLRISDFL